MQDLVVAPLGSQHLLLQKLQRAIYEKLQQTVGHLSANMVASTATDLASNSLYPCSLRLLRPLVLEDKASADAAVDPQAQSINRRCAPRNRDFGGAGDSRSALGGRDTDVARRSASYGAQSAQVVSSGLPGTAEGNVECQGPGETHESSHGDARDRAAKQQPPVVTWTEVSPKRPPGRQLGQPTLQRWMGNRQLVAVPRAGGDGRLQDCRGGGVVLHNGTACAEARGSAQHQPDRERLCVVLPDGMLSMVPNMHKATTVWQKAKAENPQNLTLTLRSKLLQRFTTVWLQCLDACLVTEESKKQAAAIVILNDPQCGRHSSVLAIQQGKEKFFRCGFARKKQIAAGNTVPDWLTQECAEQ
ncbi:unnamed protein product [Symbiodinium necroappetens]|uniref:Uncharacterized protein n=1 Tax=Symbiodinium necroappetens TaxID=1628268 RepID=A0A812YU69_9DINO|nr:unnamed protein product [Symbiodinium necroappetens]